MEIHNNHTFSKQSDVNGEWYYYRGTWAGAGITENICEKGLKIGGHVQSAAAATQTKDMR